MKTAMANSSWITGTRLRMAALAAIASAASASGPASAEPATAAPETAAGAEVYFDGDSWRALVDGKTLYYQLGPGLFGKEYYVPGSDRAVFVYEADKTCYEGKWSEKDGLFCFEYDGVHCFLHLRKGDEIFAQQSDGVRQKVVQIKENEPLNCADDLFS